MTAVEAPARELVVPGTPVSLQATRSLPLWRARVTKAAREAIGESDQLNGLLFPDLRVWIVYFHTGEMEGDVDNIAKPILDGLLGPLHSNDRQVAHLTVRRIRLDATPATLFEDAPACVLTALASGHADFVFVRATPYSTELKIP